MINKAINELFLGNDLSKETAGQVMNQMMEGEATDSQMGAYLAALRMKGETIDEITASAEVMRDKGLKLSAKKDVLDIVGTGGDELNSFNISTISAFVVAAAGVAVAKHGNRSVSSKCGSADVLEALGANIFLTADQSAQILEETDFCFMIAQTYHSAMKHVAPVRKQLGARTMFNILGPLANPAGASKQLLGVYDEKLVEPLAQVLNQLNVKRAMVVHGHDGLDEITITDTTTICEVTDGKVTSYFITPEQFGLERGQLSELIGGGPEENAQIALDILNGEQGARRNIVVMNAACCLYMGKDELSLRDCVRLAEDMLDSGKAKAKLDEFIAATNRIGQEVTA